jgi:predicted MFS family arabinose efflux permease
LAGFAIGVAWFGLAGVFYCGAVLALLAATLVLRLPSPVKATSSTLSPLRDFTIGLEYVKSQPQVRRLLITSVAVIMIAFPYVAFLPRLAAEEFSAGANGYGIMAAVSAVGAVVASLLVARHGSQRTLRPLHTATGFGFGLSVLVLGLSPSLVLGLTALFVVGGASASFQAINGSLLLMLSDRAYHGRVQSLMMLAFGGFGVAALPLGLLADAVGLRTTLAIMGLLATLVMVASVRFGDAPSVRRAVPV